MTLIDSLIDAKRKLESPGFPKTNERMICAHIIEPILRALGWPYDFSIVRLEYQTDGAKKVDYALCPTGDDPICFIEAKAAGITLDVESQEEQQLFGYASNRGVPIAILTNGSVWYFYYTQGVGRPKDRLVDKLDLIERPTKEAGAVFERYLGFDAVKAGSAKRALEEDHNSVSKRRKAKKTIEQAWNELIGEPDDIIVAAISEKVQSICGTKPSDDDVISFLSRVYKFTIVEQVPEVTHEVPKVSKISPLGQPSVRPVAERKVGVRRCSYSLLGREYVDNDATEAMISIFRKLGERDKDFFRSLAAAIRGTKRNHLAIRKEDVYPGRPDIDSIRELVPGWWIGTNISNREKLIFLEKACDVARIQFGKDLVLELS